MLLRSTIGNPDFNRWWFIVSASWKWCKFWLLILIWPWRSWLIATQNNKDLLDQGLLHLWSKFGDPSINSWWVTARTSSWLMGTHTHTYAYTHAGNDNIWGPNLTSVKNLNNCEKWCTVITLWMISNYTTYTVPPSPPDIWQSAGYGDQSSSCGRSAVVINNTHYCCYQGTILHIHTSWIDCLWTIRSDLHTHFAFRVIII